MDCADEEIVSLSHEAVRYVHDKGILNWLYFEPLPGLVQDFQSFRVRCDNCEALNIGMCTYAPLIVPRRRLLWVVQDTHTSLGPQNMIVKRILRDMQSKRKQPCQSSRQSDHGCLIGA